MHECHENDLVDAPAKGAGDEVFRRLWCNRIFVLLEGPLAIQDEVKYPRPKIRDGGCHQVVQAAPVLEHIKHRQIDDVSHTADDAKFDDMAPFTERHSAKSGSSHARDRSGSCATRCEHVIAEQTYQG